MKKGATNTNGIEGLMPAELVKLFYEKRVSKYGRLTVMFIRKILGYPIWETQNHIANSVYVQPLQNEFQSS